MNQHIIELNNRYQIKAGENQDYLVYRLELNAKGQWQRTAGKICRTFAEVIEVLLYLEILEEDASTLTECKKILEQIHAEIKDAICTAQSW